MGYRRILSYNFKYMFNKILRFFDKKEDKIRHALSKHPIVYALIGGFLVVIFWRGVWDMMDMLYLEFGFWFLHPVASLIISIIAMLATGTFVSFFIGEQIIISGLKEEKRIDQKTEQEIEIEDYRIKHMTEEIGEIRKDIAKIKAAVMAKEGKKKEKEIAKPVVVPEKKVIPAPKNLA